MFKRVAELNARVTLSDFGEVPAKLVVQQEVPKSPQNTLSCRSPSPSKSAEYKVALELEMWKDAQEKLFEQQV